MNNATNNGATCSHALRSISRRGMFALLVVAAVASVAPTAAVAQKRGKAKSKPSTEQSRRDSDTVATDDARESGAEEPADLAFRTLNGTNPSPASLERPITAPPHLSQRELRVIDTRRRSNDALVPLRGYPTAERAPVANRPGYADASIGMHATAQVQAGYSATSWPFDYYGTLAFDISEGYDADNAHRVIGIGAGVGYIIDEGFGMFSGGHMGLDARYDNTRYHLFALDASPVRTSGNWSIATTGSNSSAGLSYDAGARYRALSIDDSSIASRETSLEGTLSLGTSWQGLAIGASGDMRLTYLDGASISYGRVAGFGSYSNRILTARAGLQFSAGENSDGSTSGTIAPTGELRIFPLHGLTLIGTVTGGLAPTTLAGLSAINPYIELHPEIRQQRESIGYQFHVRLEPSRAFALRLTGARSHYNDYAYFDSLRNGRFAPQYGSAIISRITGDLSWRMDDFNSVLSAVEFTEGEIDDASELPYTPKWIADLLYTRRLSGTPLAIDAGARYIGTRPAPGGALDPVLLVNLAARYALSSRLDLTLQLRNLLDRRYELWEGYVERGVFASLGAAARF
jgi:outer membrane receptor protein involved in Fe transport